MLRLIYGHWLKTKRTPIRWLSCLLPILYSSSLFLYFYTRSGPVFSVYQEFQAFFLLFMMVALFSLSFYIPLLCTLDKEASLFGNELRIGVSRNKLFVSKYFFILGLVGFIEGLSFTTFASLQFFLSNRTLDFYLICFFLLAIFISLMPMVLSYLFLTLVLNESGSLIFGVLFTLSGILLGTTALGSKLWYVIPWTWGFRLVYKIIPKEILQGDFKNYWQIISESLLTSVLFLLLELFWYNRWEGVSKLEE